METDLKTHFTPDLTGRSVLIGMLAMNVLFGLIIAVFVCSIPMFMILSGAILQGNIFHSWLPIVVLIVVILITALLGYAITRLGAWCVRELFSSNSRRILVSGLLLCWHVLLVWIGFATFVGAALVVAVLSLSIFDRLYRRQGTD